MLSFALSDAENVISEGETKGAALGGGCVGAFDGGRGFLF